MTPEGLYSSRFMQDGIKNYFTRLEQARKMKREATDRLGKFFNIQHFPNFSVENWGRSKSTRKQAPGNQGQGIYASTSSFQTPVKGQGNTRRSKRRTLYRNNSQFNTQEEENYPYSGENQENKHPEFEQHQQ